MKLLLIIGLVVFFILIISIGNKFARKYYQKKTGEPPDEMYPLF